VPPSDKRDPLRDSWEEVRQTERWAPPLLAQLDEAAVFIFRDGWPRFTAWLRRSFPRAAEALPSERWAQIGWAALALVGVDWVVRLGPETGHNVTLFVGWSLAGIAGWHVWRRLQQTRRDELAQHFVQLTSQLGAESMELRIAALGALDQLAYDNPRYRLPLLHLLLAWLDGRQAEQAADHDSAVARQMVQEFRELLAAEPGDAEPFAVPAAAPVAAAEAAPAGPPEPASAATPAAAEPVAPLEVVPTEIGTTELAATEPALTPEATQRPAAGESHTA
jgi:hypothetical protein